MENNRTFAQSGLLMSLLLANGTPMLLAGDEFGNTQYGNNNAYCQDNEITWLKWANFNEELFELTKQTIALPQKNGQFKTKINGGRMRMCNGLTLQANR